MSLSHPISDRSTWEELPPEVFEQTLASMDDNSLLTLSKVNHFFNYAALERFFGEVMMSSLLKEAKFSNIPLTGPRWGKPDAVEALRLSFWLRRLEHIHHCPSHNDLLIDMQSLKSVITRIPALISLHLQLKGAIIPSVTLDYDIEQAAAQLCDIAIAKGCKSLKLVDFLSFSAPARPNSTSLELNGVTWQMMESSSMTSTLVCVQICGALLMFPPFPYILNLLATQSKTIRRLHFDSSTFFVPLQTWEQIFCSLNFPHLDTFIFDHYVSTRVHTPHLVSFLRRHPTITTLRLFCGLFRGGNPFQGLDQPTLPNLSTVEAESRVTAWILQNPFSCSNVRKVVIKQGEANPRFLDEALYSIAGPGRLPPDKIILNVELYSRSWLAWMTRHVEDEYSGLREVYVVNLAIRAGPTFTITSTGREAAHCFGRWVALFPALRRLEILRTPALVVESAGVDLESIDEQWHDIVLQYCPNLESFVFVSSDYNT